MNKVLQRLSLIFFVPFTLLSILILLAGTFTTIYYDIDQGADLPRFGRENFLYLLPGVVIFAIIAYFLTRNDEKRILPWALLLETALCLAIIFSARAVAVTDGLTMDEIMNAFNAGDYSSLDKGGYMYVYPFQIGYAAIGQIIGKIFGPSNYLVFQLLNLITILVSVVLLHQITWELFESRKVCAVLDLISLLMFFLFMYVTYVYNDVWSVAPGIAAIYFEILYLKRNLVKDEILAAVFLGLGCILKTNLYIALIAMAILLAVNLCEAALEKKENLSGILVRTIVFIVLLAIMALCPLKILGGIYAKKAGLETYPEGVPSSTYFAMAMQEGEGEWGWYNGFNRNTYDECDYDRDLTDQRAKQAIEERLSEFKDRPLHAVKFYLRKFLTQWADPTFVAVRNFELSMRHSESTSSFARSLVNGVWSRIFQIVMDIAHFIVYLGVVIYSVITLKKKSLTLAEALPILFVFGGMLFHELWEGSSRYIIRYYLMLLPFAAYGITELIKTVEKRS